MTTGSQESPCTTCGDKASRAERITRWEDLPAELRRDVIGRISQAAPSLELDVTFNYHIPEDAWRETTGSWLVSYPLSAKRKLLSV